MDAGYDPNRLLELRRHTLGAIDSLARLGSPDPAASEAMRTIRLTRRNLEDQWMTAVRDIERSDAMVSWRASRLRELRSTPRSAPPGSFREHLLVGGSVAVPVARRDELLARLAWFERTSLRGDDAHGAPTDAEIAALARELAPLVARDAGFAEHLVELSTSNMLIGRLLGEGVFPSSFASDVIRRMAVPNGPDTKVDRDRYAESLSTALTSLVDDPAACLDVLLDKPTTYALATWGALDAPSVTAFVISGLYEAVAADPARLADGYAVLAFLTRAANGPLDGGMSAGVALGVAASLSGYIETLAPAIRQEGDTPVVVRAVAPPLELGTYDDLVDLFGALLRAPQAQAALGTVLAAFTLDTLELVGGEATARPEITHVARFADLIGDASRTEQAELVMAAAAAETTNRRLAGLVGFGVNVALTAGAAVFVVRATASQAVRMATDWTSRVEPDRLPESHIPARVYDMITVAAVAVVASDPVARRAAGLTGVTSEQWSEAMRYIEAIDRADDPHERTLAEGALDHWIETSVPVLATYLVGLRSLPGMDELTEGRNAVGAD